MFKKIILCLAFFLSSTMSCSEKKVNKAQTECDQIKDIVTDCLNLHRGALKYVKSCGDSSLEEIKKLNTCEEIFQYIENI